MRNHYGLSKDEQYDCAMVEAVRVADRLERPVELVARPEQLAPAYGYFDVRIFGEMDAVRGETVRPGTPLTARQCAIRDALARGERDPW